VAQTTGSDQAPTSRNRTAPPRVARPRSTPGKTGQGGRRPLAPQPPHSNGARRRVLAAVAVVVLVGAGLVLWAWQGRDAAPTAAEKTAETAALNAVSGLGVESLPPWPAPADAPLRAHDAGLGMGSMGTAEHYHVHLDVLVNGEPVPVPANLGVDGATGAMTYLHTHDEGGLVHIEAGRAGQPFTLGQLFTQWDVRLTATQLGGLHADSGNTLTAYVNGRKRAGDPARLRLAAHQQISLVYGPADAPVTVASSYPFAKGD
jgi:hypothetical protein